MINKNKNRFPSLADIKKSACAGINEEVIKKTEKIIKELPPSLSPEKKFIDQKLQEWVEMRGLYLLREYRFHPDRMWRFDWCVTDKCYMTRKGKKVRFHVTNIATIKIGVEYEGIFSAKSRHTTAAGFTGDTEKYNAAQAQGFNVIRYTAINYSNAIQDVNKLIYELQREKL